MTAWSWAQSRWGFQRTLRIPETGLHPLPPSLGQFPLRRVADYPDSAPSEWLAHGGVMLPVYQEHRGIVCRIDVGDTDYPLRRNSSAGRPLPRTVVEPVAARCGSIVRRNVSR